jgi:serine/threonine-protein kinase HipA
MNNSLDVYLHQILAGQLNMDRHGDLTFTYHPSYLSDKKNQPLSQSLPLQKTPYTSQQCRPFFGGILPEAQMRAAIARQLGISEKNDFALLAAIGGECAGAVSLLPSTLMLKDLQPGYRVLDEHAVSTILQTMHQRPMIAGEDGIRLSLAGAQDKLPIAVCNGQIAIPINGAPSTHILKPVNKAFPTLIENECFCLQLANSIGLNVAEASMHVAGEHPYLLVKRYDRILMNNDIHRLHQEDFCQALAIVSEMKYQREGGPGLVDCFQLIRKVSSLPAADLKMLLQGILFNLIIGNNDAHGKNFSLLYHTHQIRLAPFYDMISTIQYPSLSQKMAMKIGGKYDFDVLFPRHILKMAEEAQLSRALVQKEILSIVKKVQNKIESTSPYSTAILERADKIAQRFKS